MDGLKETGLQSTDRQTLMEEDSQFQGYRKRQQDKLRPSGRFWPIFMYMAAILM